MTVFLLLGCCMALSLLLIRRKWRKGQYVNALTDLTLTVGLFMFGIVVGGVMTAMVMLIASLIISIALIISPVRIKVFKKTI